jgi:hypothetical protein
MNILLVGAELFHVDRRTDLTKLTVTFRNFAKAPKISYMFRFLRDQGSKHVDGFNVIVYTIIMHLFANYYTLDISNVHNE